jgi:hypothetical protein
MTDLVNPIRSVTDCGFIGLPQGKGSKVIAVCHNQSKMRNNGIAGGGTSKNVEDNFREREKFHRGLGKLGEVQGTG